MAVTNKLSEKCPFGQRKPQKRQGLAATGEYWAVNGYHFFIRLPVTSTGVILKRLQAREESRLGGQFLTLPAVFSLLRLGHSTLRLGSRRTRELWLRQATPLGLSLSVGF